MLGLPGGCCNRAHVQLKAGQVKQGRTYQVMRVECVNDGSATDLEPYIVCSDRVAHDPCLLMMLASSVFLLLDVMHNHVWGGISESSGEHWGATRQLYSFFGTCTAVG